jgi:predicted ATPase
MIQNIKAKNFKVFKNLNIELQNLNILTGLNGTGKSSLIQILLILRQSYLKELFEKNEKYLALSGEYIDIGDFSDAIFNNFEKEEAFIRFEIDFENANAFWQTNSNYVDDKGLPELSLITSELNNSIFQESLFKEGHFQYVMAERIGPRDSLRTNLNKVNVKDFGADGSYALQYFLEKANKEIEIKALGHPENIDDLLLITQINAWLNEISPNIKIKARYSDANKSNIESLFSYGVLGQSHKAKNVGFGVSYVFSIILSLLTAEANDLIILENPEAHLHPRGQSKLAELMCLASQNGVQIICETHSDHIINGIMAASYEYFKDNKEDKEDKRGIAAENVKIYFFQRNNDFSEAKEIFLSETGRIRNPPKGFFDQFNLDLKRLIQ